MDQAIKLSELVQKLQEERASVGPEIFVTNSDELEVLQDLQKDVSNGLNITKFFNLTEVIFSVWASSDTNCSMAISGF